MSEPTEQVERLVRIETKMDVLIDTTDKRGVDHETRLRALEQFKWVSIGAGAAAGGVAGMVAKVFGLG